MPNPALQALASNIAAKELDPYLAGGANQARALLFALINQESGWNPRAGSHAGAQGLTQLMPGTAAGLGVKDVWNPRQNLTGGARYLAQQLRTFGGDIRKALAAYNAGPGAVQKYGGIPPYRETQNYVSKIMAVLGRGSPRKGASNAPAGTPLPAPRAGASADEPVQPNRSLALLQGLLADEPYEQLLARVSGASGAQGAVPNTALPRSAAASSATSTPRIAQPSRNLKGALAEAFYDPLGGFDEGRFIGAIGGHSNHVHASLRTPAAALAAIKRAQALGLRVGENPYTDPVDPVHTEGSFHYRTFPGLFQGKKLGQGIDVSGEAEKMAAFYRWLLANLR